MTAFRKITLAAMATLLSSCGHFAWQAGQLPGLRQISDSMNEKAFVEWMSSDPEPEVRARVADGDYRLVGMSIYDPIHDKMNYTIPGVADDMAYRYRDQVTSQGMGREYKRHIPLAEAYMTKFNRLMLGERRGVTLDFHGLSPKHENYSGSKNNKEAEQAVAPNGP